MNVSLLNYISNLHSLAVLMISTMLHNIIMHRYLISKPSSMTESERDQIDSEAQQFIRSCSERIQSLRDESELACICTHNVPYAVSSL